MTIGRAAAALALAVVACSVQARAASNAAASPAPTQVPFVVPAGDEEIHGRIAAVPGKFALRVRDDRGFIDDVTLHQGTVILPSGLTLKPGMLVRIAGVAAGSTFKADVIATPYAAAPARGGFSAEDCAGWSGGAASPPARSVPPGFPSGLAPGSC